MTWVSGLLVLLDLSRIGDIPQMKVSVVSTALFDEFLDTAAGGTLVDATATVTVHTAVEGMLGFEQQAITTQIACPAQPDTLCSLSGSFTLSFNGMSTRAIAFDASAADMKSALALIGVRWRHSRELANPVHEHAGARVACFVLGYVPNLQYSALGLVASRSDATISMDVREEFTGRRPSIASNARSSVIIPTSEAVDGQFSYEVDLPVGTPVHARISVWNGGGDAYGRFVPGPHHTRESPWTANFREDGALSC